MFDGEDLGGFEIELSKEACTIADVVKIAQESFPQQGLHELFFVLAEDGKIVIAVPLDAPTKAN